MITMKRGFVLLLALLGCGPNFQSGKTKCSDSLECPGGYTCGSEQLGGIPVCYAESLAPCAGTTPFFCKWANVCAPGPTQCPSGGTTPSGPESCTDPDFPAYCPALGGAPAGCWETDTDCTSVTSCGGVASACAPGKKIYCSGRDNHKCCAPPQVGGECNLPACGCPKDYVCFPDTVATGLTCIKSSGLPEGAACGASNAVCAEGFGCFGGLCKSYCKTASDCLAVDGARECSPTYWAENDQVIPDVSVCTRVCDPVSPQNPRKPLLACPVGYGCDSGTGNPGASDCYRQPGTLTAGATCATSKDCAPGHYCSTGKLCMKFCYTAADCPIGMTCNDFTPGEYAGTTQVGYCK